MRRKGQGEVEGALRNPERSKTTREKRDLRVLRERGVRTNRVDTARDPGLVTDLILPLPLPSLSTEPGCIPVLDRSSSRASSGEPDFDRGINSCVDYRSNVFSV